MSVYRKDQPSSIQELFGSIAPRYDMTNAVLSLGLHRLWNRRLVNTVLLPIKTGPILDLCCGTGQIAWTYLKKIPTQREVHLIDFCPEMLTVAKQRAATLSLDSKHNLSFTQGDAQAIPLENHSMAVATIAYGIRNVHNPKLCFQELTRVLKPGGKVGILELTRPNQRFLRMGHAFYLNHILPTLGRICTTNYSAYSYLSSSIDSFIEPRQLVQDMYDAGFAHATAIPLLYGTAHLLIGQTQQ
jgi:demethylmenaquinone methyltransferase/2-methoxy-6-polyprenyl-1,4-benzoquinol methylase